MPSNGISASHFHFFLGFADYAAGQGSDAVLRRERLSCARPISGRDSQPIGEEGLGRSLLYAAAMEQFLRDKYADREIDIVVPVGEYPLQFLQTRRKAL